MYAYMYNDNFKLEANEQININDNIFMNVTRKSLVTELWLATQKA